MILVVLHTDDGSSEEDFYFREVADALQTVGELFRVACFESGLDGVRRTIRIHTSETR